MISVIIPCYNCENTLARCVKSVLAQTLADFEILLIDDGSRDRTAQLAKDLAEKNQKVQYFRKENGGPGSARNFGLDHASGDYILFVDSDDYMENDMLETLYQMLKDQPEVSMAACRAVNVREESDARVSAGKIRSYTVSGKEALAMFYNAKQFGLAPWCKLIRREAIGENRFPEIYIAEDAVFLVDILLHMKQVAFTTAEKYYVVNHKSSLRGRPFNENDYESIATWDRLTRKVLSVYPDLVPATRIRYYYSRFYVLDKLMLIEKPDWSDTNRMEKIIKDMKKYPGVVYTGPFTKGRKFAFLLLNMNPSWYRAIIRRKMR